MEDYLGRLKSGSLKLYALEQELPADEAVRVRRAYIMWGYGEQRRQCT